MSVTEIVYLVNKTTRQASWAGQPPASWNNIAGLNHVDYEVMSNLEKHFPNEENTYRNMGFLTEADALAMGVQAEDIERLKRGAWELKWQSLEDDRYVLIEAQQWRVNRHTAENMLGNPPTEDILPVLQYMQAIRDLPKTYPNPFVMVWPPVPA